LPYEVKLAGERVVGETGPFREVLADLSTDLTPPSLLVSAKALVAGLEEGGPDETSNRSARSEVSSSAAGGGSANPT